MDHRMDTLRDKIEILPVDLLDEHRLTVTNLNQLARSLRLEFGWHYLLDITWILAELGDVGGKRIMDAGAGTGIIQWYLAENGAEVISVDRTSRANLPMRFRSRFRAKGMRQGDLAPVSQVLKRYWQRGSSPRVKISSQVHDLAGVVELRRSPGQVIIYNQDLKNMPDIEEDSLDAVVAVSALEHNSPDDLELVISELMRVLKPGGALVATLAAAREQDWFHEASHGWCYTDRSLRRLFDLMTEVESNYDDYDRLLVELRECAELRDNLARFYFQSGDNGMPWGVWDPQYQPVGVCKVKKEDNNSQYLRHHSHDYESA
jgi:ubiquinone/menaquinone biosynthesis C-methylase UbiE